MQTSPSEPAQAGITRATQTAPKKVSQTGGTQTTPPPSPRRSTLTGETQTTPPQNNIQDQGVQGQPECNHISKDLLAHNTGSNPRKREEKQEKVNICSTTSTGNVNRRICGTQDRLQLKEFRHW